MVGLPWGVLVAIGAAILFLLAPVSPRASKLNKIPGPWLFAATRYRLALNAWKARSVHTVHRLHKQYGPVVRIGPNEISFNSLSALKTIFGAGSGFERTAFYRMFDVYGRANLFTFASGERHRDRKKLISNIYANKTILGPVFSPLIQAKVAKFLSLIESQPQGETEVFNILHFFSFDTITEFVYGPNHGATAALSGSKTSQDLIQDLLDPSRRRLSWFTVHFPAYTKWITSRTGLSEKIVTSLGLMPMQKPFVFSGIRQHAWKAFNSFKNASESERKAAAETTLIGRLFEVREEHQLEDVDIASECADHLLAGIDTTADSLMFLFWALSLPQNKHCQEKLRQEVSQVPVDGSGLPKPKDLTRLPYLNAVIRETLRLYSPLPSFEPRSSPMDAIIDGYVVPAGTIVGMSPYCLHRDETVFESPETFIPERWLTPSGSLVPESDPKNRQFWAFSSGARMCIGMHLANAELLTMTAGLYRKFSTSTKQVDTSPSITSRYELFHDETTTKTIEHECWINFKKLEKRTLEQVE